MTRRFTLIATLCAAALALPAGAQSLNPGLWQTTSHFHDSSGQMEAAMAQMQQRLAQIPPEQRTPFWKMMADKVGQVDSSGGRVVVEKVCATPEMVKNLLLPVAQDSLCTQRHSPLKDGKMELSFNCPKSHTRGTAVATLSSQTSYTMKGQMHGDDYRGTITAESEGRWLGADCGNIKPPPMGD